MAEPVLFAALAHRVTDTTAAFSRAVAWLGTIAARARTDTHGEPLTAFVDEFFIARELFAVAGLVVERKVALETLVNARKAFLVDCLCKIEEIGCR
jgi:hypothetical protein